MRDVSTKPSLLRRLAAVVALACFLGLVLAVVGFLFRNAGALVIALTGLALVVAGGWWAVTERMPRRAVGFVLIVAGLVCIIAAPPSTSAKPQPNTPAASSCTHPRLTPSKRPARRVIAMARGGAKTSQPSATSTEDASATAITTRAGTPSRERSRGGTGLLESPDVVLDDPDAVEHARNTQHILASKAPRKIGPDDNELAAILAGARTP